MNQRTLLTLIEDACREHGVTLVVHSDGWLIEMSKAGRRRRIVGSNFDMNDQAAAAIARDKVATSSLLGAAGVRHVAHRLLRSRDSPHIDEYLTGSLLKGADVVVKPLEGSSGSFVARLQTLDAVRSHTAKPEVSAWAISPFIDIDHEIRLVIVDDKVCLAHAKVNPVVVDGLKLFNLSKGATAKPIDVNDVADEQVRLAMAAMQTIGLHIAAVDLAVAMDGQVYVLEVNAAFSLTRYAKTNEATYAEVASFYDFIVGYMFD